MAFDGVSIGISDGLAKHEGFFFVVAHLCGCPGLEPLAGAVQALLLPGNRNQLATPTGLTKLLPLAAVGLSPEVQPLMRRLASLSFG